MAEAVNFAYLLKKTRQRSRSVARRWLREFFKPLTMVAVKITKTVQAFIVEGLLQVRDSRFEGNL